MKKCQSSGGNRSNITRGILGRRDWTRQWHIFQTPKAICLCPMLIIIQFYFTNHLENLTKLFVFSSKFIKRSIDLPHNEILFCFKCMYFSFEKITRYDLNEINTHKYLDKRPMVQSTLQVARPFNVSFHIISMRTNLIGFPIPRQSQLVIINIWN